MMLPDMRTIILSKVVTDIVCFLVILALWHQSRKRFEGMDLWALFLVPSVWSALSVLQSCFWAPNQKVIIFNQGYLNQGYSSPIRCFSFFSLCHYADPAFRLKNH